MMLAHVALCHYCDLCDLTIPHFCLLLLDMEVWVAISRPGEVAMCHALWLNPLRLSHADGLESIQEATSTEHV